MKDHDIIEDLNWRYTVKKYDPKREVSEEKLAVLFEAMRLSASSINSQPWRFIVLQSNEAKARMHATFEHEYHFNQPHILEASHIILFAHRRAYGRQDYAQVVDAGIKDGRTKAEDRESSFGGFFFAELNTDELGDSSPWTKAQLYLALGNTLQTLARLRIDSTPMEGIDSALVSAEFSEELEGYQCELALAIGYRHVDDLNARRVKSRLPLDRVLRRI